MYIENGKGLMVKHLMVDLFFLKSGLNEVLKEN